MSVDLLLSAGRGPQECAWAVAQLARRLADSAARQGLAVERREQVPAERSGTFRSVVIRIRGNGATRFAASWTGTLCWQAPSPYRKGVSRKNWYVIAGHPPASGETVVVDTERHFALNRSIAVRLLRSRLSRADSLAAGEAVTARWRIHDELVRGDPVRVERPAAR
jgi:peptide chain release factor